MIAFSPSITATNQDKNSLQQVWHTINEDSCPLSYNFHMHTVCSDGKLTPLALIQQAIHIGLKGLAITDHHSVEGYYIAQKWLKQINHSTPRVDMLSPKLSEIKKPYAKPYSLGQHPSPSKNYAFLPHLWTGVEITSSLQGVEVHILGFAFDPNHLAINPYLQGTKILGKDAEAEKVIDSIHQAGGLAVLAHPARYRRPASELIPLAAYLGIDGVEAYYAYGNTQPWKPSKVQTQQVKQLAMQYNLYTTCGTDSHGLSLCQRI